ncbi:uncharacterized protein LOC122082599 [Macadamia integrifolia]|uniref:uncharacterized protein LOC122082599 n=1 Tax=Macadamia integrifolia TaxID=60698 RepID=UPI001C4E5B4B|nr:uncharacterized protein LOC122082599 [Macadamia integrifolia]
MGKATKEHLSRLLSSHLNNIHETLQVFCHTPAASLEKVSWDEVIQMGEQVSKQATVAGVLWTGDAPDVKELEENMGVYFNMLQGFLLHTHGSTVGAGPTLCSSVHASAQQIVNCSFSLMKEAVSSYGSRNKDSKLSIPHLAGTVWDACNALKKTPTTNYTAIGRAITQVAVSVKDVLREMKELKPGSADQADEMHDEAAADVENEPDNHDNSSDCDLGNDLSLDEMKIAQLAIDVVSDTLIVLKELIRFISSLLKQLNSNNSSHPIDSLERLLKISQGIGVQVDELGASLYPPQEVSALKTAAEKISVGINEMKVEVSIFIGPSEGFLQACEGLDNSVRMLESKLSSSTPDTTDLQSKMHNVAISM